MSTQPGIGEAILLAAKASPTGRSVDQLAEDTGFSKRQVQNNLTYQSRQGRIGHHRHRWYITDTGIAYLNEKREERGGGQADWVEEATDAITAWSEAAKEDFESQVEADPDHWTFGPSIADLRAGWVERIADQLHEVTCVGRDALGGPVIRIADGTLWRMSPV